MKTAALVGFALIAGLVACGESAEPIADPSQSAVTTSATDPAKAAGGGSDTAPGIDPATPATPTAPAGPATCESLAAAAPAGKLDATKGLSAPHDVYATEDLFGLHIVLTDTPGTCAYHANKLQAHQMNEKTFTFDRIGKDDFTPGKYDADTIDSESGEACQTATEEESHGFTGTATSGDIASGKLTVTAKTDTSVSGTVDVTDFLSGDRFQFTFTAPICASLGVTDDVTCCE